VPNYIHKTINHSSNLGDPLCPSVHTQSIEVCGPDQGIFLKKGGLLQEQHSSHLINLLIRIIFITKRE